DWFGHVRVWEVASWRTVDVVERKCFWPVPLAITPDSRVLIVGSGRKEPHHLVLRELDSRKTRTINTPGTEIIHALGVPGGGPLVCLTGDKALRFLDWNAGGELGVLHDQRSGLFRFLVVARSGQVCATRSGLAPIIDLWDVGKRKHLRRLQA